MKKNKKIFLPLLIILMIIGLAGIVSALTITAPAESESVNSLYTFTWTLTSIINATACNITLGADGIIAQITNTSWQQTSWTLLNDTTAHADNETNILGIYCYNVSFKENATRSFVIDNTDPSVSADTLPSTSDTSDFSWTVTVLHDNQTNCRYSTTNINYTQMDSRTEVAVTNSTTVIMSLVDSLGEGSYTIYVACVDDVGNYDAQYNAGTIEVLPGVVIKTGSNLLIDGDGEEEKETKELIYSITEKKKDILLIGGGAIVVIAIIMIFAIRLGKK